MVFNKYLLFVFLWSSFVLCRSLALIFFSIYYAVYFICFLIYSTAPVSILLSPLACALLVPQLFKEELTQVKEGMKHINDLAHQLAISDVHLSMENARALEHLNSRWKVLQVEFTGSVLSV